MMSNRVSREIRSPLDDYFADVEMSEAATNGPSEIKGRHEASMEATDKDVEQEGEDWGDETLVNTSSTSMKGWTGSRPNTPGPSSPRHPRATLPAVDRMSVEAQQDAAAFAERFKYLVCTSGLLEKDFIGSAAEVVLNTGVVGGRQYGLDSSRPTSCAPADPGPSIPTTSLEVTHSPASGAMRPATKLIQLLRQVDWAVTSTQAVQRWDISLAGAVLVLAIVVVVGVRNLAMCLGCLSVILTVAEFWPWRETEGNGVKDQIGSDDLAIPVTPDSAPSGSPAGHNQSTSQNEALCSLEGLLRTCSGLDAELIRSLALLARPNSSSISSTTHKPLRVALHRLCGEMTDHIASCVSGLAGLVDSGEVGVLSEMYDVRPEGRGRRGGGRISGTTNETESNLGELLDGQAGGGISGIADQALGLGIGKAGHLKHATDVDIDPVMSTRIPEPTFPHSKTSSPHHSRHSSLISLQLRSPPATIRPFRLSLAPDNYPSLGFSTVLSVPMSSTQSLPSRLSKYSRATGHARHLSLASPPHSAIGDDYEDDRFTSIPLRTPRLSKRASWDPSLRSSLIPPSTGTVGGASDRRRVGSMADTQGGPRAKLSGVGFSAKLPNRHGGSAHQSGMATCMERTGSGRRIRHEKRITEADEGVDVLDDGWLSTGTSNPASASASGTSADMLGSGSDGDGGTSIEGMDCTPPALAAPFADGSIPIPRAPPPGQENGLRPLSLSSSPTLRPNTPKFASPLSGSRARQLSASYPGTGRHFPASLTDSAMRLAALSSPSSGQLLPLSPLLPRTRQRHGSRPSVSISPPTAENPKRRSLQNMPYCFTPTPGSPISSRAGAPGSPSPSPFLSRTVGEKRTRTMSLVSSASVDLQSLRTRSATGSTKRNGHGTRSSRGSMSSSRESVGSSTSEVFPPGDTAASRTAIGNGRPSTLSSVGYVQKQSTTEPLEAALGANVDLYGQRPPHRIPSVSPLTLPALKAACLGIHLKRRRVAISLLALRFSVSPSGRVGNESSSRDELSGGAGHAAYWEQVRDVLDSFREAINVERAGLGEVHKSIEGEIGTALRSALGGLDEIYAKRLTAPWNKSAGDAAAQAAVWPNRGGAPDFAPRLPESGKMAEHCEIVQRALTRAWAEVASVQRYLHSLDMADDAEIQHLTMAGAQPERNWAALREELGIMVREAERGRETLRLVLAGAAPEEAPGEEGEEQVVDGIGGTQLVELGELPGFLQAWDSEMSPAPSTHAGSVLSDEPLENVTCTDDVDRPNLPPAGMDEVFEAYIPSLPPPRPSVLGTMSRDERVGMMRLAREQGLTLGEYMRRSQGTGAEPAAGAGAGAEASGAARQLRERGGRMVDELKEVIGLIRTKKGQAA